MVFKRNLLIVLAAASLALTAGCSTEETCADDECIAEPVAEQPFETEAPGPVECEQQCAHLAGCDVINDLECEAMCGHAALSSDELECISGASCRGVLLCLDVDPKDQTLGGQ